MPTFEFGRIHVNTIRYSPFSNLVLFGGFGNLVGDIQIWNKETFTVIGKNKAHCTTICEWSPDGSQILTAVTHPRVRVDNEVKIFTYYGKKAKHRKIDKDNALYCALWQPRSSESFPKIEIPEGFKEYSVEEDPEEIAAKPPPNTAKKGMLNIPISSAFGNMMRAEMNAVLVQGPRKLKKDDYKEFMIETVEEKKELAEKPVPKSKAAPKNSWRTSAGFKIPEKEKAPPKPKVEDETAAVAAEPQQEEQKLVRAPQEYRAPPVPGDKNQANGGQNSNANSNNQNSMFSSLGCFV